MCPGGGAKFQCTDFEWGHVFSAPALRGGARFQCAGIWEFLHPPVHFNNDRSLSTPPSDPLCGPITVNHDYIYEGSEGMDDCTLCSVSKFLRVIGVLDSTFILIILCGFLNDLEIADELVDFPLAESLVPDKALLTPNLGGPLQQQKWERNSVNSLRKRAPVKQ